MTPLKTIIATAVIAVGGTVAAFSGLHIGQTNADAATANQAVKAKTTYSVTLTAKQLAKLMHGQNSGATHRRGTSSVTPSATPCATRTTAAARAATAARTATTAARAATDRAATPATAATAATTMAARTPAAGAAARTPAAAGAAAVAGKTHSHRWEAGPRGSASQPWVQTKRERQRQQAKVKR